MFNVLESLQFSICCYDVREAFPADVISQEIMSTDLMAGRPFWNHCQIEGQVELVLDKGCMHAHYFT